MKASWYSLGEISPGKFESLRKALLKRAFTRESLTGFKVQVARASAIQGTYIEKTEFVERTQDPFGEVVEIARIRYDSVEFRVSRQFPELEILSPPRSVRGLLSEISRGLDFDVSIEKREVPLLSWIRSIEGKFRQFEVTKMVFSGLVVGGGALGQLTIAGERDIRLQSHKFVGSRSATLRKVCFSGAGEFGMTRCELYSACRAAISGDENDEVLALLRSALSDAIS